MFAGGIVLIAEDVSMGDGSCQADTASLILPFCTVGKQDMMPGSTPGYVKGALGNPGYSFMVHPWAASHV